jgi:amidase
VQTLPAPDSAARGWLRRLERREVSARELVSLVLDRMDAVEPSLGAVVARDDTAVLEAADSADVARSLGRTAPLLGLPVSVKDSIEVAGLPCSGGSLARSGHVAATDAAVVARLRAAGAIVVAKTNVPEYTWSYETENVAHGRTCHPLDPERTPGGSSGGEAALIGAGASLLGIGTDGGGSIRVPSHYCGIAGLRPTAGLVPETGCWPPTRDTGMLDMSAVGPMGRCVDDLALVLPVVAGRDDVDPFVQGCPVGDPLAVASRSLRVGVYDHDGVWPVSAGTRAAVAAAGAALAEEGCRVEQVSPPDVSEATELFFAMMAADGGARARQDLAPAAGRHVPQLSRLLEDLRPLALDAPAYFALVRRWAAFRSSVRAFVNRFDVVVAPVAAGPAPLHGCTPGSDDELESYLPFNYTHAYSLAGLPVAVVRAGTERSLPVGVQVVAGAFRDHVALAAAAAIERRLGCVRLPSLDGAVRTS